MTTRTDRPARVGVVTDQTGALSFMGVANANVARMVIDDINAQGGLLGQPIELFIEDSETEDSAADAASTELRLIWLLDPQPGFNADLVCAGEFPAPDAGGRVMEIRAVFCHRGRPLSAVHGWMRRPETVDDAKLPGLISQMSRQLLSGRG